MKIIGIDPGKSTGIAIITDGKLTQVSTSDFWGAIDVINDNPGALFVVELSVSKHVWQNNATSKGAIQRTSLNVGSVLREAELLINYLGKKKHEYIIQKPGGKKTKDDFNLITGWTGRTNQHERDAGLLAWMYKGYVDC